VEDIRWILVEGASSRVSSIFLGALMLWLVIVFLMFGIVAPRNSLIYVSILLASLSVSSTLFVILDLDAAMSGLIRISSQPLRDALLHMDQPPN
jgi:membrane protein implicated in regulation of membrane protease activity